MNFGCQADVFQLPHHRQYLFVGCNIFGVSLILTRLNMKLLFLLLFPTLGFAQSKLYTISLVNNKVKILAPVELSSMNEQMWTLKYQKRTRPIMVLTDEDGEVNLIADMTS